MVSDLFDRWHGWARSQWWLSDLTAVTRVLLAIGFIPPGLIKVLGQPFTRLGHDSPIGAFFDAFFHAQAFYAFVGWAQVIAGVLLLWPRTATLGAVLYLPIITNIFVITTTLGFRGTWLVTLMMTIACLYLLAWDYPRWRPLLPVADPDRAPRPVPTARGRLCWFYVGLAISGGAFFLFTRSFLPIVVVRALLPAVVIGFAADVVTILRRRSVAS